MENNRINDQNRPDAAQIDARIGLLCDFLNCNGRMFISSYNMGGTLLENNLSHSVYDTFFRHTKMLSEALAFCREQDTPLILTSEMGLMWSIASERDAEGEPVRLFVMGPVVTTAISREELRDLNWNPGIAVNWKPKLRQYLQELPVLQATEFYKYTLMLHYAVTGLTLKPSNIVFISAERADKAGDEKAAFSAADFWANENSILSFIRNGDIYYKKKIASASSLMNMMSGIAGGNLTDFRQSASIFCGLAARAAIEGGISPDTAYERSRIYLKDIENARSSANITSSCFTLFEDFLFLVHNNKARGSYSELISACIELIENHTADPLSIDYLAEQMNYNKYYLSKRFKKETGISVNSFIKKARIDRASYLLVTTKMSIQEISDLLLFGNRNFFTKTFKEYTGKSPAEFRDSHRRH